MNYRHQFHAGNFADVVKHALLVALMRALQKKEKGFLYLDTHAGRGSYDLMAAARGGSLARKAEWPEGIGRLWNSRAGLPSAVEDYLSLVHGFDRNQGNTGEAPRFYPGSPWLARLVARPQDRLALSEKHPAEFAALRDAFQLSPGTTVQEIDGYIAVRAMLPPAERRALVLIDPPFEAQDEFAQIGAALGEGLRRFAAGIFAVWYPLTERARVDAFFAEVFALKPPPTLSAELMIAGDESSLKMKGCGLAIVNPPWGFDATAREILEFLAPALAQSAGARENVSWLVPEK